MRPIHQSSQERDRRQNEDRWSMPSRRRSDRSRSPLEIRRRQRKPSPACSNSSIFDLASLKKFQVILKNVASPSSSSEETIFNVGSSAEPLEVTLKSAAALRGSDHDPNKAGFGGPDGDLPPRQDQREIQIEIRRNIRPDHKVSTSPIRRSIRSPATVVVVRRPGEGAAPIFDLLPKRLANSEEQRIVVTKDDDRSPSPLAAKAGRRQNWRWGRLHSDDDHENSGGNSRQPENGGAAKKLKDRLGGVGGHTINNINNSNNARPNSSVKDRLGQHQQQQHRSRRWQDADAVLDDEDAWQHGRRRRLQEDQSHDDRVLSREELLDRRPITTATMAEGHWEQNPESVPRSSYYFEHDDRESGRGPRINGFRPQRRDRGGAAGFVKGGTNDWQRGGRGFQPRGRPGFEANFRSESRNRKRPSSPGCWKHDLYEEVCDDKNVPT